MKAIVLGIILLGFGVFQHAACNHSKKSGMQKQQHKAAIAFGGPVRLLAPHA